MSFKIGNVYSFSKKDKQSLMTYSVNNRFYMRYDIDIKLALYLGDIGYKGYTQTMISFLSKNEIVSIFPGDTADLVIMEIV